MGSFEVDLARHEREQDAADRYTDALNGYITSERIAAKLDEVQAAGRATPAVMAQLMAYAIANGGPRNWTGTAAAYDLDLDTSVERFAAIVMAELHADFERESSEASAQHRFDLACDARDAA